MGIITILIILFCISSGNFSIGVVSGSKLGSCYKSNVVLKTALVFSVVNLFAISLSFILGRLLHTQFQSVIDWIPFILMFLIGIRLLLESIEKSPSLNYTDIVQSSYLIKVAVQAGVDSFFLGFVLSLVATNMLLATLFFSAVITFFATTVGLSHGHAYNKTVLGNRLELISGVIMVVLAIRLLILANS